jgi:hypothetical protein
MRFELDRNEIDTVQAHTCRAESLPSGPMVSTGYISLPLVRATKDGVWVLTGNTYMPTAQVAIEIRFCPYCGEELSNEQT